MTDRIPEIRSRVEAATPGPWVVNQIHGYTVDQIETEHPDYQTKPHGRYIGETGLAAGHAKQNFSADSEFIAHSREDIPYLLAEIEARDVYAIELEAEIERLRASADSFSARLGNIAEIMRTGGEATAKISDIAIALGNADD